MGFISIPWFCKVNPHYAEKLKALRWTQGHPPKWDMKGAREGSISAAASPLAEPNDAAQ